MIESETDKYYHIEFTRRLLNDPNFSLGCFVRGKDIPEALNKVLTSNMDRAITSSGDLHLSDMDAITIHISRTDEKEKISVE